MTIKLAEYLWIDGSEPTRQIRSKAKVVNVGDNPKITDFDEWSFDGSSTNQADGGDSDCILKPVNFVKDPLRGEGNFLVLCEVFEADGETPHSTNNRVELRKLIEQGADKHDVWMGFEQEYTLFESGTPLGWPASGFPGPQGPYYCGVGSSKIFGRQLVEEHTKLCNEAGIMLYGINAEVMPGQWEFQIGYRGLENEKADALNIADHVWISRWLIERIGEDFGIEVSFENKPIKGDWNGAGMHTNFSTKEMRDPATGIKAIEDGINNLSKTHNEDVLQYGHGLAERLTGLHETCGINEFKYGAADRGCSIRIPRTVYTKKCGYFEDRRPGANSDPYKVASILISSVIFARQPKNQSGQTVKLAA